MFRSWSWSVLNQETYLLPSGEKLDLSVVADVVSEFVEKPSMWEVWVGWEGGR